MYSGVLENFIYYTLLFSPKYLCREVVKKLTKQRENSIHNLSWPEELQCPPDTISTGISNEP
jgi:hypothetical protein